MGVDKAVTRPFLDFGKERSYIVLHTPTNSKAMKSSTSADFRRIMKRGYPDRFKKLQLYRWGEHPDTPREDLRRCEYLYGCTYRPFGGVSPLLRAEIDPLGIEWDLRGATGHDFVIGTNDPLPYRAIDRCEMVECDARTRAGTMWVAWDQATPLAFYHNEREWVHVVSRSAYKGIQWQRSRFISDGPSGHFSARDRREVLRWFQEFADGDWRPIPQGIADSLLTERTENAPDMSGHGTEWV